MNWSIPSKHLLLSFKPPGREYAYIQGWIDAAWNKMLKEYERSGDESVQTLESRSSHIWIPKGWIRGCRSL